MTALHKIGASLRTYRKRQGLTGSELAQRSGIHRNTLSALENGHGNVELNTLLAVCEQLGLDLSLIPSKLATIVEGSVTLPSLPQIQRTTFSRSVPSEVGKNDSAPTSSLQRRIVNRLKANTIGESDRLPGTDKEVRGSPATKVKRLDEQPREIRERVLNKSLSSTYPVLRDAAPTALQRRISARLARSGSRKTKDGK